MKDSPEIVRQLESNPLPASLEVALKDPKHGQGRSSPSIKANPAFPKVIAHPDDPEKDLRYGQQIIDQLFAFTRVIAHRRVRVHRDARHRVRRAHRQHDPARDLRAPPRDRRSCASSARATGSSARRSCWRACCRASSAPCSRSSRSLALQVLRHAEDRDAAAVPAPEPVRRRAGAARRASSLLSGVAHRPGSARPLALRRYLRV